MKYLILIFAFTISLKSVYSEEIQELYSINPDNANKGLIQLAIIMDGFTDSTKSIIEKYENMKICKASRKCFNKILEEAENFYLNLLVSNQFSMANRMNGIISNLDPIKGKRLSEKFNTKESLSFDNPIEFQLSNIRQDKNFDIIFNHTQFKKLSKEIQRNYLKNQKFLKKLKEERKSQEKEIIKKWPEYEEIISSKSYFEFKEKIKENPNESQNNELSIKCTLGCSSSFITALSAGASIAKYLSPVLTPVASTIVGASATTVIAPNGCYQSCKDDFSKNKEDIDKNDKNTETGQSNKVNFEKVELIKKDNNEKIEKLENKKDAQTKRSEISEELLEEIRDDYELLQENGQNSYDATTFVLTKLKLEENKDLEEKRRKKEEDKRIMRCNEINLFLNKNEREIDCRKIKINNSSEIKSTQERLSEHFQRNKKIKNRIAKRNCKILKNESNKPVKHCK
ncbi:hypothetical protein HBN50_05270 [Halobacteriovorax sp. GB3]|uniref:hypothetical protein n=1 Tax=Halobacteriovorax sp. GB3 TaxID=2719615 RepID=UPI00236194D3|nr:hypothetical protein [Halobacteriovorax sp. GB3]MDD0852496.1 hypothetical protein [Halobacteriovorax sp. GB3]